MIHKFYPGEYLEEPNPKKYAEIMERIRINDRDLEAIENRSLNTVTRFNLTTEEIELLDKHRAWQDTILALLKNIQNMDNEIAELEKRYDRDETKPAYIDDKIRVLRQHRNEKYSWIEPYLKTEKDTSSNDDANYNRITSLAVLNSEETYDNVDASKKQAIDEYVDNIVIPKLEPLKKTRTKHHEEARRLILYVVKKTKRCSPFNIGMHNINKIYNGFDKKTESIMRDWNRHKPSKP